MNIASNSIVKAAKRCLHGPSVVGRPGYGSAPPVWSCPLKAIVCTQFGGPALLDLQSLSDPKPGPREVRIAVAAAGVNFPDTLIIQGKYQYRAEPPFVPGAEVAGEVVEVGDQVSRLKVGDRVAAFTWSAATPVRRSRPKRPACRCRPACR